VCLLKIDDSKHGLVFAHRVVDGATEQTHYGNGDLTSIWGWFRRDMAPKGIQLAKLCNLPPDVIATAERVAARLDELDREVCAASKGSKIQLRRKELLKVGPFSLARLG
jgi:hypothetical protein